MTALGSEAREIVDVFTASTVAELTAALGNVGSYDASDIINIRDRNGDDGIQLTVIRTTLTDGSCVYDLIVA